MSSQEGFETWRDATSIIQDLSVPPSALAKTVQDGEGFNGRFRAWNLGSMIFTSVSASPQRSRRSQVKVATSDLDHYLVTLCMKGQMRGDAHGVDLDVGPGDLWFCDLARPKESVYTQFDNCV